MPSAESYVGRPSLYPCTPPVIAYPGEAMVLAKSYLSAVAGDKQPSSGSQGQRALQLSLSVGKTNLLLRNLLRTPILELEAANINVGKFSTPRTMATEVLTMAAGVLVSAWPAAWCFPGHVNCKG